nr:uncharacterized protein LOC123860423 [Mirounga angustirostris]
MNFFLLSALSSFHPPLTIQLFPTRATPCRARATPSALGGGPGIPGHLQPPAQRPALSPAPFPGPGGGARAGSSGRLRPEEGAHGSGAGVLPAFSPAAPGGAPLTSWREATDKKPQRRILISSSTGPSQDAAEAEPSKSDLLLGMAAPEWRTRHPPHLCKDLMGMPASILTPSSCRPHPPLTQGSEDKKELSKRDGPSGLTAPVANGLTGGSWSTSTLLGFSRTLWTLMQVYLPERFSLPPQGMNHFLSYPARHLKPYLPLLVKCPNRTHGDEKATDGKQFFILIYKPLERSFLGEACGHDTRSQLDALDEHSLSTLKRDSRSYVMEPRE